MRIAVDDFASTVPGNTNFRTRRNRWSQFFPHGKSSSLAPLLIYRWNQDGAAEQVANIQRAFAAYRVMTVPSRTGADSKCLCMRDRSHCVEFRLELSAIHDDWSVVLFTGFLTEAT